MGAGGSWFGWWSWGGEWELWSVGFGDGGRVVRCGGPGVVFFGGGDRFGGRGIGFGRWIGGERDRSTDQGFELSAGDAELLAEADGREVALAVVG